MRPISVRVLLLSLVITSCVPSGIPSDGTSGQVSQPSSTEVLATASVVLATDALPSSAKIESTNTVVESATMLPPAGPIEQGRTDTLTFFWPEYIPSGYSIQVYPDRTMVDDLGYRLYFESEGYVIAISGGNPILPGQDRPSQEPTVEGYCASFVCEPATIGEFQGVKSNPTGAGWGFFWELGTRYYSVGTTGPAATELEAVVRSLVPVSKEELSARISQAP